MGAGWRIELIGWLQAVQGMMRFVTAAALWSELNGWHRMDGRNLPVW